MDKMRVIAQCSSLIVKNIDEFWKSVDGVPQKDLVLDVDQLLMIMIYVVIKCQLPDIYAHFKLANMYATNCIKQSKLGYYTQTLQMCIEQVINFDEEEMLLPGVAVD